MLARGTAMGPGRTTAKVRDPDSVRDLATAREKVRDPARETAMETAMETGTDRVTARETVTGQDRRPLRLRRALHRRFRFRPGNRPLPPNHRV